MDGSPASEPSQVAPSLLGLLSTSARNPESWDLTWDMEVSIVKFEARDWRPQTDRESEPLRHSATILELPRGC